MDAIPGGVGVPGREAEHAVQPLEEGLQAGEAEVGLELEGADIGAVVLGGTEDEAGLARPDDAEQCPHGVRSAAGTTWAVVLIGNQ